MRHRARLRRTWLSSIVLLALFLSVRSVAQRLNPPPASRPSNTQVVMLGTGTPGFDIARSGPATAIVVNGTAYLVDFGAGVMRRAKPFSFVPRAVLRSWFRSEGRLLRVKKAFEKPTG